MIKTKTLFIALLTTMLIAVQIGSLKASSLNEAISSVSELRYQSAAAYSHLKWQQLPQSPISVELRPIQNYSGIPLEQRDENSDYFNHGKIPQAINPLFSDLLNASRYFDSNMTYLGGSHSDYRLQLSIDSYQLPFKYEPDDIWWKELNADLDRWFASPKNARIKLSLSITSGSKHISNWMRSIEMTMDPCDLNSTPQPLTSAQNDNQTIRHYVQTTPGQAFVAASNYLILQAIDYINQKQGFARVVKKEQNEIFLKSNDSSFVLGETLGLYYQRDGQVQSILPVGRVQIIKTYNHQAVAYPVDIRADQIKAGDWVEVSERHAYIKPKSVFEAKNQCAKVMVAQGTLVEGKDKFQ